MTTLTPTTHDSWSAIFAPAAQSASDALARWTNGRVRLELDEVAELELEQLSEMFGASPLPSTAIIVSIAGDHGGQLILVFEDSSAKSLVESLLRRETADLDSWGELQWSALKETGNICASAFLSAIRAFADQSVLLPSPPVIVRDYVSCIIEQAVMPQLIENDSLLLCQTRMTREGEAIAFSSLFVPTPLLVEALRRFIATSTQR
jgi:chemotaxis protein CheC